MLTSLSYLNVSAPFTLNEHEVEWKLPPYGPWGVNTYPDFNYTNSVSRFVHFTKADTWM